MRIFAPLLAMVLAGCSTAPTAAPPAVPPAPPPDPGTPAAQIYPPSVHLGEVALVCNIDASKNGQQTLRLVSGGGIEFDAVVSPIIDGTVALAGAANGGSYEFTSHLAEPAKGTLSGVGEVEITELETKVSVALDRYSQPDGAGAALSFEAAEMASKGIYLEFAGRARAPSGEEYAFRINLGSATGGEGQVQPADAMDNSRIESKRVVVEAPAQTSVQSMSVPAGVPAATSVRRTQ